MEPSDYKKLLHNNITQEYKLDTDNKLSDINKGIQKYARALEVEDRMECEANAFITIKDHKQEFPNSIKCRVINPASNNLGRVSKRILYKVNHNCRVASGVNQCRSTQDVLQWFSNVHSANPTKEKAKFLQFDICEFYSATTKCGQRKTRILMLQWVFRMAPQLLNLLEYTFLKKLTNS